MRWLLRLAMITIVLVAAAAEWWWQSGPASLAGPSWEPAPSHAGAQICAQCHAEEFQHERR
jgi:cytochrome c553